MWLLFKEWLIGKLGGIPLSSLTVEELQRIHNRMTRESMIRKKINSRFYGKGIFESDNKS